MAASSSGTPSPVMAVVTSTSGRFGWGRSVPGAAGEPAPLRRAVADDVGPNPGQARARRGREHRPQLRRRALGTGPVALVDDDDVGDLEQARLDGLDLVAHLRRLEDDRRVGRGRHLHLALAGADRLEQDHLEAGGVENGRGGHRRGRQPAGMPARGHAPDEDAVVGRVGLHPHAVAQDRAAGDRRGRVHGDDGDGAAGGPRAPR